MQDFKEDRKIGQCLTCQKSSEAVEFYFHDDCAMIHHKANSDHQIDFTNGNDFKKTKAIQSYLKEDTWVQCCACQKWRMLSPQISEEEVEALPDEWYCKDK